MKCDGIAWAEFYTHWRVSQFSRFMDVWIINANILAENQV